MRSGLPAGSVTFLFTDVEGSTKLLHELGTESYANELAKHRRVVREACTARDGVEVDTQGDAFFVAFPSAAAAVDAARAVTKQLASGPIALRIGLHTGTPLLTDEGYIGEDVHFAARVAASGHGGQVVLSQATRGLLDDSYELVDLGEHRLKDIPEPVPIFQLGSGTFPPLKTISNTNLPRPSSSFVGRERELSELLARIEQGVRLLTLTGPGGSGKTRLAIEAAATLVPKYKAGVFWIGLASLRDDALVTGTIAQALGAKDGLVEHIGEREMLLLLDNLEQVIEAAPELSSLLQDCPNLSIMVTSRELLRVHGEVEYQVPPLAQAEAVSLFCERAQTEATDEISDLCGRLDNLPLAVELAAARARGLSPAQMLERLSQRLDLLKGGRDADPRQQTLRATIEWSYELLSKDENKLFRRLSVFAGGCLLESAEEVAAADLDNLLSLVDKSLLQYTNERYWMLETIREYALGCLADSDEEHDVRAAHARYFRDFASRRRYPGVLSDPSVIEEIDVEQANFREAFAWGLRARSHAIVLSLLDALWLFWLTKGRGSEAYEWARRVVASCSDVEPADRLAGWHGASEIARFVGDSQWAEELKTEEVATARATGNDDALAFTLGDLSQMAAERGDISRARDLAEEAVAIRSRTDDEVAIAHARFSIAYLEFRAGNFTQARDICENTLRVYEAASRRADAMGDRTMIGACLRREGDFVGAAINLRRALDEAVTLGHTSVFPDLVEEVAGLAQATGDSERAATLLGASDRLYNEAGIPTREEADRSETIAGVQAALGDAHFEEAWSRGAALEPSEAIDVAKAALDGLAGSRSAA